MAGLNQILDPWLYILLRHSGLIKIAKHIKRFLCKDRPIQNSSVNKRDKGETTDGNLEIRVVCAITAHNSEASESEDSVTSTSKLIQANLEPQYRLFVRSLSAGENADGSSDNQHSDLKVTRKRHTNGVIQSERCQNTKNIELKRMKRLNSSPAVFSQTFL